MRSTERYAIALISFVLGINVSLAEPTDSFVVAKNPIEMWALEVAGAKESIDVATFKFSSKEALAALVAAQKRGLKVTLLIDGLEATKSDKQFVKAREAGLDVYLWPSETIGEFHAKFTLIDAKVLVVGSFNLSKAASKGNTESFLITRDTTLVGAASASFKNLLTQANRQ